MSRRAKGEGSVYKDKSGAWRSSLLLPTGKRKYFYGRTRKEVTEKLHIFRQRLERGAIVDETRTVAQYLDWWLKDQKRHLATETWRGYESKVRLHIRPTFENVRLVKLSPMHVRELVSTKIDDGHSSRHVNNIYDVLHTAIEDARRMELVDRNVVSLVDTPKVRGARRTALTADQAWQLLDVMQGDPLEPLYRTLLTLGLRPGEGLGLRWSSVQLNNRTVRIETTLQRHEGEWVIKETPKNDASEQTLPLPNFCRDVLAARKEQQDRDRKHARELWQEWGLVFTRENGAPIWYSDANRHLAKLCKKAGVPKVTMHELRHSAPSILLSLGVDQRVIMRILRHSTIVLTANLYTHVVDPLVSDALDKIDGALGSSRPTRSEER